MRSGPLHRRVSAALSRAQSHRRVAAQPHPHPSAPSLTAPPPQPPPTHAHGRAGANSDLVRLNATTLEWLDLSGGVAQGSPPSPRYYHGMAAALGAFVVFGGTNDAGGPPRPRLRARAPALPARRENRPRRTDARIREDEERRRGAG